MREGPHYRRAGWMTVLGAALALGGWAQSPPAVPNSSEAVLARAASLYASTGREGLKGFDCAVHPEWRAFFLSIRGGKPEAADERKIAALNAVKIHLHARLKGGSTLEWEPTAAREHAALLAGEQKVLEQTLMGFLEFWTPFVDGSLVPASASDMVFVPTADGGYRLDGINRETAVMELFDANLVLRSFEVKTEGATILVEPTFSSSPQGLRVSHFLAHIRAAGSSQDQMLRAGVVYGESGGFQIPQRIDLEFFGSGSVNAVLDHCQVNPRADSKSTN